ncbi:MAG: hypothetical protein UX77_C0007G0006 [Parcubacteria group bacterium GW2011_GWA1_47_11]|uniref:Uncharacterized protein n=1 Tax=Candidatus Colwellbacteria bacterium GWA2_46_10 TaxID=1797684 RepID=A0A1G1YWZ7_9BACT|nr:MAG: hypothetical protein UX29_C0013G0020 [Parcubacteria group bacterium GW2011_GWA2_46_10]KKU55801.1 MAG: hypothetical protein UX77_C0007G0006 [Parcubacteria group bacterium GW2011_GWA1_47_11]OGY56911.1 MAG: hypothetical protein A2119_02740 [Candidatus Colwellbacteria bacterium GWA2_46_10]
MNGHAFSNYTTAITGEITLTAKIRADDYIPEVNETILSQYESLGNGNFIWRFLTTGKLTLYSVSGGVGNTVAQSSVTLSSVGCVDGLTDVWVRMHHVPDNGAGNSVTKFYYSFDITNNEDSVNWTQLGSTQTSAAIANRDSSTYAHKVGVYVTIVGDFFGRIYQASARAGDPTSPVVYNPRFSKWETDDTSRIDDKGVTWTLQNDATIQNKYGDLLD